MESSVPTYYKRITVIGLVAFVALAIGIIVYFSQFAGSETVAFDPIDSSSCIACHTDETVIAQSTFGQDAAPAEAAGG